MISDSWYIGAFGKWWKGGVLEEWYQDVVARSKDEESWTSGILNMKRLDMLQDYKGLSHLFSLYATSKFNFPAAPTFNANSLPIHLSPGTPPRLRNRERHTLRNDSVHPRNASPPPLPMSASLPMHAVRNCSRVSDTNRTRPQPHVQPCVNTENLSSPPSQSSSPSFEHTPEIADVLRQITSAKSSVAELRTQLTEYQCSATESKTTLQQELDAHRHQKRQEDASKADLKTRTKILEDSKRNAEGIRREAEKKLKAAQSLRDIATQRIEHLDTRILQQHKELAEDREFISCHMQRVGEEEREFAEALEQKRIEIKTAEDQAHTLNQRSRELEEKLASGREKLRMLRENAHIKGSTSVSNHQPQISQGNNAWIVGNGHHVILSSRQSSDQHWNTALETLNGHKATSDRGGGQIISVSGFPDVTFNGNGYIPFADSSSNNGQPTAMAKSNFVVDSGTPGLGEPFDDGLSRSFKSDNDALVDKHLCHFHGNLDRSSTTVSGSNIRDGDHISSFSKYANGLQTSSVQPQLLTMDRIWPQSSARPSKGLNPDAKEFNLFPASSTVFSNVYGSSVPSSTSTYDALTPNGFPSATTTTTNRESLLRAFALSPAERETLQRTLGGLSNTSFERLPNLNDMGSTISSSPSVGTHALPRLGTLLSSDVNGRSPLWLQSGPRNRKVNFDPWDDEPQDTSNTLKN